MANLKNNTTTMQEILDAVNALPEAGSGGVDVSGVTATADDVVEGKIFVDADGNEQVGTIPEITAQNVIITPKNEETKRYTIPAGRHDGTGSVRIITQSKTVTPSTDEQTITADSGYTLRDVVVKGVSEGAIYTPNIEVDSSGVITATTGVSKAGYLEVSDLITNTKSLTTQSGKTVTPSTSTQTAVASGRYTTGTVYVAGDNNLISSNIKSGVSIFGVNGSCSGGEGHIYNGVLICEMSTLIADIRYVGFDLSNAGGTNNLIGAFIRPNAASESLANNGLIAAFADIENSKLYQVYGTSYSTFSCTTYSTTYYLSNGNLYIPKDVLKTTYDNMEYLITPIYKT